MPNKTTTDNNYRYNFQGQEKDPETGMEAFELRLWDGRLGRWLTVDPYGEFYSPYVGMGNNPMNLIDPDGGITDPPKKGDVKTLNGAEIKYDGKNWLDGNGKAWFPNEGNIELVLITGGGKSSAWKSVGRAALDFVPLAGSGMDIYEGFRDGNGWQVAMGATFLVVDIVTLGSGTLVTGASKTAFKVGAKEVGEQVIKKAVKIQRHHIIPKKVFRDIPELIDVAKRDIGQNLKKLPSGFHGNHPAYSKYVNARISKLQRDGKLNAESIKALQKEMSHKINEAYKLYKQNGQNLNTYFKN